MPIAAVDINEQLVLDGQSIIGIMRIPCVEPIKLTMLTSILMPNGTAKYDTEHLQKIIQANIHLDLKSKEKTKTSLLKFALNHGFGEVFYFLLHISGGYEALVKYNQNEEHTYEQLLATMNDNQEHIISDIHLRKNALASRIRACMDDANVDDMFKVRKIKELISTHGVHGHHLLEVFCYIDTADLLLMNDDLRSFKNLGHGVVGNESYSLLYSAIIKKKLEIFEVMFDSISDWHYLKKKNLFGYTINDLVSLITILCKGCNNYHKIMQKVSSTLCIVRPEPLSRSSSMTSTFSALSSISTHIEEHSDNTVSVTSVLGGTLEKWMPRIASSGSELIASDYTVKPMHSNELTEHASDSISSYSSSSTSYASYKQKQRELSVVEQMNILTNQAASARKHGDLSVTTEKEEADCLVTPESGTTPKSNPISPNRTISRLALPATNINHRAFEVDEINILIAGKQANDIMLGVSSSAESQKSSREDFKLDSDISNQGDKRKFTRTLSFVRSEPAKINSSDVNRSIFTSSMASLDRSSSIDSSSSDSDPCPPQAEEKKRLKLSNSIT